MHICRILEARGGKNRGCCEISCFVANFADLVFVITNPTVKSVTDTGACRRPLTNILVNGSMEKKMGKATLPFGTELASPEISNLTKCEDFIYLFNFLRIFFVNFFF